MANLTLSIDGSLLRNARIRALEQGTTVNSLVRQYLERLTNTRTDQAPPYLDREPGQQRRRRKKLDAGRHL